MRVNIELPIEGDAADGRHVAAFVAAADEAGFTGLTVTDHPAPRAAWLDAGGHPTFDPFAVLAFAASASRRLRLITNLVVLPYRHPRLLAKSVATVDRLSGGRLTLAVGAGYLRSEFSALGVDFEHRNALVDEALEVLTTAFTEPRGDRDVAVRPGPVQLPHPPIWIGGNSRLSRERVVRFGAGWSPILAPAAVAQQTRTPPISDPDALAAAIDGLREDLRLAGRDPSALRVHVASPTAVEDAVLDPDAHLAELRSLAAAGATDVVVTCRAGGSPARHLEAVRGYGATILDGVRR